jgi:pimeloyl-ACP methyl ester carboxylesterase
MSTADVARDMDLLRQAVGDTKLTYDGVSYGSYLGNVYANLFPGKVRALIVDGVLDPVAWATGRPPSGALLPFSTRLGSAHGADGTLEHFFDRCDAAGPARCAFAPGSRMKFARLDARAKRGPIPNGPGGGPLTYDVFNNIVLGQLYDSFAWDGFAAALQEIYDATFSPSAASSAAAPALSAAAFAYDNGFDAFLGVACADTVNPRDPAAWPRAIARQAQPAPYFAVNWGYASEPCSTWPVVNEDHYLGPFDRATAAPVLVIGNRWDPATPYHGAKTVDELLPRSRLLTLDYAGHTSWGSSRCVNRYVTDYLVAGALPPVGTACKADFEPFSNAAPSAQAVAARALVPKAPAARW